MTSWYLNKYVYISYSCLFHVLDTAIVSSSQIYLTRDLIHEKNIRHISQVLVSILTWSLLLCYIQQRVEATTEVANISLYYLVQLNQELQLCMGDIKCMDNFLTVLSATKNDTNPISFESKVYNTDNVPIELPFP